MVEVIDSDELESAFSSDVTWVNIDVATRRIATLGLRFFEFVILLGRNEILIRNVFEALRKSKGQSFLKPISYRCVNMFAKERVQVFYTNWNTLLDHKISWT